MRGVDCETLVVCDSTNLTQHDAIGGETIAIELDSVGCLCCVLVDGAVLGSRHITFDSSGTLARCTFPYNVISFQCSVFSVQA